MSACPGILSSWATIVLCQLKLLPWSRDGIVTRPSFQLFGAPFTSYLMLLFRAAAVPGRVLALIAFDYPVGTWTVGSLVVIVPLLVLVWFLCRDRIIEIAPEREGFTGGFPMVAKRPRTD